MYIGLNSATYSSSGLRMMQPTPIAIAHVIAALTVPTGACGADTLSGRVVGIADGDTLTLLNATLTLLNAKFQQHKVRLVGIDVPKREQPFGTHAKQHLSALVFGNIVNIDYDEQDHYGRKLDTVLINGKDIDLKQTKAGLAFGTIKPISAIKVKLVVCTMQPPRLAHASRS